MTSPVLRRSGILLHPSSLPGAFGSGDLGASAYHFVDWLVAGKQRLWQILPLGGLGPGNSPYMSPSAFAGNELLIDLEALGKDGLLEENELRPEPSFETGRVNYATVKPYRLAKLRQAAARFFSRAPHKLDSAFTDFCKKEKAWLDDYALFMALDHKHGGDGRVWQDWPTTLVNREAKALETARKQFADECNFWKFCQWLFFTQWASLKSYANARGIDIIGDVPVFVSPHSADVWANQTLFDLDDKGHPTVVAGVPPDYFSATGQHWGNPLYRWSAHKKQNYRWWIARMRTTLSLCDIVRIDHFRGFESYWEIPADSKTAINGQWKAGPGQAFFQALFEALGKDDKPRIGKTKIIAEDLGVITKQVIALREGAGLPGMRILQFAFDGKADNLYLPHNFDANTVAYTGTHDNDTTCGWWNSLAAHERDYVCHYLGIRGDHRTRGESIHWEMIRTASASVAALCIIPLQDVLGLDSAHRMNQPSMGEGAWEWRFHWGLVEAWHAERLADLAVLHGRTPDAYKAWEDDSL